MRGRFWSFAKIFSLRFKSNYGLSRTFLSTNTYFHLSRTFDLRMLPENWSSFGIDPWTVEPKICRFDVRSVSDHACASCATPDCFVKVLGSILRDFDIERSSPNTLGLLGSKEILPNHAYMHKFFCCLRETDHQKNCLRDCLREPK